MKPRKSTGRSLLMRSGIIPRWQILAAAAFLGLLGANESAGALVETFFIGKGQLFTQARNSEVPVVSSTYPFALDVRVRGTLSNISHVIITPPKGYKLQPNAKGLDVLGFRFSHETQKKLEEAFPPGIYSFAFNTRTEGIPEARLELVETNFPNTIPAVVEQDPHRGINPFSEHVFKFSGFEDMKAGEAGELEISDERGLVYLGPVHGNELRLPKRTLGENRQYAGRLRWIRITDRNDDGYAPASGTAGIFNETEFTIVTGFGVEMGDFRPPEVYLYSPYPGMSHQEPGVIVWIPFDEPMSNSYSVRWSTNLTGSQFSYRWQNQTFVAVPSNGFPMGAGIEMAINPTAGDPHNFQDLAGNHSRTLMLKFSTGQPARGEPCETGEAEPIMALAVVKKSVRYVQRAADGLINANSAGAASFSAIYRPAAGQALNSASLSGMPMRWEPIILTNAEGMFEHSQSFASLDLLEEYAPDYFYDFRIAVGDEVHQTRFRMGAMTNLPVPGILNFAELASVEAGVDLVLSFEGLPQAGPFDRIDIEIRGEGEHLAFRAPDPCIGKSLPSSAKSVTVPAGKLAPGQKYRGRITFSRHSYDANALPSTGFELELERGTDFEITTANRSGAAGRLRWTGGRRQEDGTILLTLSNSFANGFIIEERADFETRWRALRTNGPGNVFELKLDPSDSAIGQKFFRAAGLE